MRFIAAVISISALGCAVTVPPVWPNQQNPQNQNNYRQDLTYFTPTQQTNPYVNEFVPYQQQQSFQNHDIFSDIFGDNGFTFNNYPQPNQNQHAQVVANQPLQAAPYVNRPQKIQNRNSWRPVVPPKRQAPHKKPYKKYSKYSKPPVPQRNRNQGQYRPQNYQSAPVINTEAFKTDYQKFFKELGLADSNEALVQYAPVHQGAYQTTFFQPISLDHSAGYISNSPFVAYNNQQNQNDYDAYKSNALKKNYRDDKTHEPQEEIEETDDDEEEYKEEIERNEDEKAPISDHEIPNEIPTRPIYPGEGQWAKPGKKHRPFVSTQKYSNLEEDDDDEEKPEGYDIYESSKEIYDKQKQVFNDGINNVPLQPNQSFEENDENEENNSNEKQRNPDDFVPTKTYAQIRKTDNVQYLPLKQDEPRLKEEISDSKIQTVYTEEGYEDLAYDHAGHEKSAETDEGDFHELKKHKKKDPNKYSGYRYDPEGSESSEVYQIIKGISKTAEKYAAGDGSGEEEDSHSAGSEDIPKSLQSSQFLRTKEIKTTEVKDAGDGGKAFQIQSEVKYVTNPDNKTTSHKYVKIYPKDNKGKGKEDSPKSVVIERTENKNERRYSTVTDLDDETPDASSVVHVVSVHTSTSERKNMRRKRSAPVKRFTNDFPNIDIDTSFIDTIGKKLPKNQPKPDLTHIKYPFYNSPAVGKHSALRYAENPENIPIKEGSDLAFYEQAERRKRCDEVQSDIDPIPERVKNVEDEPGPGDVEEIPDLPRLRNLGDKIDCFKERYFGENPLDNPFFKEEVIEAPEPIFKEFASAGFVDDSPRTPQPGQYYYTLAKENEIQESYESAPTEKYTEDNIQAPKANIETDYVEMAQEKVETAVQTDKSTKSPISLITTPSYTVKLTPKHIYDQIHLLNYLPASDNSTKKAASNNEPTTALPEEPSTSANEEVVTAAIIRRRRPKIRREDPLPEQEQYYVPIPAEEIVSDARDLNEQLPYENQQLQYDNQQLQYDNQQLQYDNQQLQDQNGQLQDQNGQLQEQHVQLQDQSGQLQDQGGQLQEQNGQLQNQNEQSADAAQEQNQEAPKSEELKMKRRPRPRPARPPQLRLNIFDINDFLPAPLPSQFTFINPAESTVLPKYKTVSEVHYKDDIKPNEQLNVFEDVINNIRTNPTDQPPEAAPEQAQQEGSELQVKVHPVKLRRNKQRIRKVRIKKPVFDNHGSGSDNSNPTYVTPNEGVAPNRQAIPPQQVKVYKPLGSIPHSSNQNHVSEDPALTKATSLSSVDFVEEPVTRVVGLVPPGKWQYKTIPLSPPASMNIFPVIGMKPPPAKQNLLTYADYKQLRVNNLKRRAVPKHRRQKRTAARPSYSEIRRSNKRPAEEKTEDEKDDYVPHRNRSFHYDDKQQKIIYNDAKENERRRTTTTTTTELPTVRTTTTTGKPEVHWVEYVKFLKNHDTYKNIPEPQPEDIKSTTQKPADPSTTKGTTTTPEYLSFVQKLKGNDNYMVIKEKDPNEKKTKTTTTTESALFEVEPEESIVSMQNSPGGQSIVLDEKLIAGQQSSESEPKLKSFVPKTAVDTSKYRTIARTHAPPQNDEEGDTPKDEPTIERRNDDSKDEPSTTNASSAVDPPPPTTMTYEHTTSTRQKLLNTKRSGTLPPISVPPKTLPVSSTTASTNSVRRPANLYARTTTPKPPTTTKAPEKSTVMPLLRRRMNRTRQQTTTEKFIHEHPTEVGRRNLRRRHQPSTKGIPFNHKEIFTPIVEKRSESVATNDTSDKPQLKITPRTVTADIIYQTVNLSNPNHLLPGFRRQGRKISDVEVFNKYDKTKKHGGNYKPMKEEDEYEEIIKIEKDDYEDDAENPTEKIISDKASQVEVIKEYDEKKKHGGNLKIEEDEAQAESVKSEDLKVVQEIKKEPAHQIVPRKISDVLVFNKYDKTRRHGGNYRRKIDQAENENKESEDQKSAEDTKFITEEKETSPKKDVVVFAKYDPYKITGGNYKKKEEEATTKSDDFTEILKEEEEPKAHQITARRISDVLVFNKYDKNRRHGGNYRRENDKIKTPDSEKVETSTVTEKPKEEIDVISDYDKNKKHGGNYKKENEELKLEDVPLKAEESTVKTTVDVTESSIRVRPLRRNFLRRRSENLKVTTPSVETTSKSEQTTTTTAPTTTTTTTTIKSDVEVFKLYNKTQRTGGNYRKAPLAATPTPTTETSTIRSKLRQPKPEAKKPNDVEVFAKYNKTQRTGGNFRRRTTTTTPRPSSTETAAPPTAYDIEDSDEIEKLVDAAPKPFSFFSDAKLPGSVNELKDATTESSKDSGDQDTTDESVSDDLTGESTKDTVKTSTKKPLFIKDPNKRLYFYAPVK